MKLLEEKILRDGNIRGDVLKVDSFINHQIDVKLISALAEEWKRLFEGEGVTKILTIEASGIGLACITAQLFDVPVLFAKKSKSPTVPDDFYKSKVVSYTHGQSYNVIAAKKYINEDDRILIIDDFLANGSALKALINLTEMGGAKVVGAGIAIEKTFCGGGDEIRERGYRIESLARISSIDEKNGITFC